MIDCEFHPVVGALEDLLPYLSEATAHRIMQSEFQLPPAMPHPGADFEGRPLAGGSDPAVAAAAIPGSVESVLLLAPQTLPTAGWLHHELAVEFIHAVNRHVAERWLPVDLRFRLVVGLTPHHPDQAVRELEAFDGVDGVVAASISLTNISLGHEYFHPLFAALAARGLPLIVHPGGGEGELPGVVSLGGSGPRTPEETFSMLPQAAQSNLSSLVFNGAFELYPELTIVFAGWGFEWAPTLLWRLDTEWRNLRVEVPWLSRPPSEVVADRVRLVLDAGSATSELAWRHAELLPESVLLFGSDAPFGGDEPYARIATAPDALRSRIERDNALDTFPRL